MGTLDRGGVEKWLVETAESGSGGAWHFDFCLLSGESGVWAPRVEALGCRTIGCRLTAPHWLFLPIFLSRFRTLLRQGGWPVVHSHVMHFSGFVLAAAWAAGVPVRVAHAHTAAVRGGRLRALYETLSGRLARLFMTHGMACSEPAAAQLFGPRWKQDRRVSISYCGVRLDVFERPGAPRRRLLAELGLPADAVVAGHVGRFTWQKNHDFLLLIAAVAIRLNPRIHFVLVGSGALQPEIQRKVDRLGLGARVRLCGARDDVPQLMRSLFDALLLPSTHEGLPVVLLEAQAAALVSLLADHITLEADVVPELIRRLSLESPPEIWARSLLGAAAEPRRPSGPARARLAEAGFDAARSFARLAAAYDGGLGDLA